MFSIFGFQQSYMFKKNYANLNSLNWYWKVFFILTVSAILFFIIKQYYLFVAVIAIIFLLQYLWQLIFCRAIKKELGTEFNLSLFAEIILIFWYLGLAGSLIYSLIENGVSWYGYLFSGILALVKIAKVLEVFANRRDFIRINLRQLTWRDNNELGEIIFVSYFFEERKTEAFEFKLTGEPKGPFLIVKDAEGKEKAFDLKQMNLGGHVRSMKKYFNNYYS